jgi:subtilisin
MKIKLIIISIILLLVMVFASGCIPFMEKLGLISPTDEEQLTPEKGGPPDGLVKVLIGFKEKPGAAQQAMVRGVGGKIKYTYNIIPAIAASIPEVAIEALKKNPNITDVELDSMVYALDAELDNSWGVKRIGAGNVHDPLVPISNGFGVKVAIIDTGIDYTHPDLDSNYKGGWDFVNSDGDPMDDEGHGTHVAGIIAAEDNKEGVVGVAPQAELYALKVLDEEGYGYVSDVVYAIQWSTVNGIKVINMSLGGKRNIFLEWACNLAYYSDGLLLVAAAGNGGAVIYPAAYSSVIAVSATDEYDNLASFSSTGKQVELAAPGVEINSTLLGGGYIEHDGTSMASPHVAGTAALVIASGISDVIEVRAKLQDTAEDIRLSTREQGYGLVDAAEAVAPGVSVTDIAITVVSAPNSVVKGDIVEVSVTAENVGNQDVTNDINVTLTDETYDVTIGIKTISGGLTAGASTTLIYSWDTASATTGDHTLMASHNFADDDTSNNSKSTSVTVNEPTVGVTITSIDPSTMKAGSKIDVTIIGSGFANGAEVTFENGNGPAPTASNVAVENTNTITATVTAKSGGPPRNRVWDVRVTNPDGSSGVLVDGFTVTP